MDIETVDDIADVFSPARVTTIGEMRGLKAGGSMDLQTSWDVTKDEDRSRSWEKLRSDRPLLAIGSPPRTGWG